MMFDIFLIEDAHDDFPFLQGRRPVAGAIPFPCDVDGLRRTCPIYPICCRLSITHIRFRHRYAFCNGASIAHAHRHTYTRAHCNAYA